MSKLIVLAALAAALLIPAAAAQAATATTLHGVVVAKEASRHVLVVASPRGAVHSVRVTARRFGATRIGTRLSLAGTRLADGSLHVTHLHRMGHVTRARLRVTILKIGRAKLLVAGGGTAFAIRLTRGTHVLAAARTGLKAGEKIDTKVELGKDGPVGTSVETVGESVLIDFSGTITALDATSVTLSSDGVTTVVGIPDGVTLPPLVKVGGEVEIVASVSGSTLTLVEIKLDGGDSGDGGSSVDGDSHVHVEGFVSALDAGSVTIQPGDDASPVTFAIPGGFTLPDGLASGSEVEAGGQIVDGVLTLTKIELQSGDDGDSTEVETQGTVTALDAGSITIQPEGDGPALTFAIPDGFVLPDGVQVGAIVSAKGQPVSSVLTLTKLELDDTGDGGGGDD